MPRRAAKSAIVPASRRLSTDGQAFSRPSAPGTLSVPSTAAIIVAAPPGHAEWLLQRTYALRHGPHRRAPVRIRRRRPGRGARARARSDPAPTDPGLQPGALAARAVALPRGRPAGRDARHHGALPPDPVGRR